MTIDTKAPLGYEKPSYGEKLFVHRHNSYSYVFFGLSMALACFTNLAYGFQLSDLKGSFTQGGMIVGKAAPNSKVALNGKPIRVSPEGHFVFGFGRDAALEHLLKVEEAGRSHEIPIRLSKRDYPIQRIEGIPKKIMSPSQENLERIRKESRLVGQARKTNSDHLFFLHSIELPVDGPITGVYGSQRFFNGEPKRPHYGLDLAAPTGSPVIAPLPGVVTLVHDDMFYSGGTLIIDHGYGISSTFIHLHKVLVSEGEAVAAGDLIAQVGASGRATGPHLDWRMNWFGVRLDPQLLLPPQKPSLLGK